MDFAGAPERIDKGPEGIEGHFVPILGGSTPLPVEKHAPWNRSI